MKLLLHTCCAPCLIHPLEVLRNKGFEVAGFFYNPNIHPFSEYKNRKQAVEDLIKVVMTEKLLPNADKRPSINSGSLEGSRAKSRDKSNADKRRFCSQDNLRPSACNLRESAFKNTSSSTDIEIIYPEYSPSEYFRTINLKEDKPQRCSLCWELRLKNTAQFAKENGFNYFSTTLLVSPYQDQGILKDIGNRISKETGIEFYYEDFRPGFREAHNKAKAQGIYCQKYCGCIYSEKERYNSKSNIKN